MAEGSGTNGEGKSRLDRIEEMIERGAARNEAAHERFERDHKVLLAAQVVFQEHLNTLELKMAETTDKLNALIHTQDEWIRNNTRGGTQPG